MDKLTLDQVLLWHGSDNDIESLASYLIWAIDNPDSARKEILNYEREN